MRSDVYKEQLVKREFGQRERSKRLYIIGIAVAVAVFFWQICMDSASASYSEGKDTMGYAFTLLIILIVGIDIYIAVKKIKELNREYEYAYTNGALDIDVIMNREKRKNVFSGMVSEFEIMAHIDDKEHLALYDKLPVSDFSSGEVLGNTYVFVTTYKGKRKKFIFEPREDILMDMRRELTPRRLYIKKINNGGTN